MESTFGKMLNKLKTLSPHETIMLRIGERPATVNLKWTLAPNDEP